MTLNKSSRIGLQAVVMMADAPGERVSAATVAQTFEASEDHVAKVLQQLVRAGICEGQRGAHGGYKLVADPRKLTMFDVVEALEGPVDRAESAEPTPSHPASTAIAGVLDEISQYAWTTLRSVTIATLASTPVRRVGHPGFAP